MAIGVGVSLAPRSATNVIAADDILKIGQRRNLTVVFHYPEKAGKDTQSLDLTFTLCAEATQTKNNPNKKFN